MLEEKCSRRTRKLWSGIPDHCWGIEAEGLTTGTKKQGNTISTATGTVRTFLFHILRYIYLIVCLFVTIIQDVFRALGTPEQPRLFST